jgi:MFS family permease
MAVFMLPAGRVADMIGRKKVFTIGIAVYVLSAFVACLSDSVPLLIAARVLQGIGGAMNLGTATAILISTFPLEDRGRVIGINTASIYTGLSAGPFLGGIMTSGSGWRSIFLVNIAAGILIIGLILGKIRDELTEEYKQTDFAGFFIYAVGLTALLIGMSSMPRFSGIILIAAGSTLIITFVMWEKKEKNPMIDIRLFSKSRTFLLSNLSALINYSATFAVTFFLSIYLQLVKQKSPRETGIILVVQPLLQALFSPIAGRLSDRIEPRYLASGGMALCSAGLFMLIFLSDETPIVYIILCLVLLGIGFALFSSPNTYAIMTSVSVKYLGAASAMVGTMRVIGQMSSMAIALMLFSIFLGNALIKKEDAFLFLRSSSYGFGIFSILCTAGIFASMSRGNVRTGIETK